MEKYWILTLKKFLKILQYDVEMLWLLIFYIKLNWIVIYIKFNNIEGLLLKISSHWKYFCKTDKITLRNIHTWRTFSTLCCGWVKDMKHLLPILDSVFLKINSIWLQSSPIVFRLSYFRFRRWSLLPNLLWNLCDVICFNLSAYFV